MAEKNIKPPTEAPDSRKEYIFHGTGMKTTLTLEISLLTFVLQAVLCQGGDWSGE